MPVRLMILDALLTLQQCVSFLETFVFVGRIFLFSARTGFPFRCLSFMSGILQDIWKHPYFLF